jgi:tetratricopeptide (TPR) repeat protein
MRTAFAFILFLTLVSAGPNAWPAVNGPVPESTQLSLDQILSIAEKQHEIAKLLIKEGRFERVLPEMRKILDLNLTGEYEQLVAKSSSFIAYQLAESKQAVLAHQLLDETIVRMRQSDNIAALLKIKAYIYKSEGKLDKAIETLERSVEIEKQRTQP